MSALVNFFLRARHWQIFLLVFVVPTIVEIAATDYVPTTIRSWRDLGEGGLVYLGLMLLDAFCLLAWLWGNGVVPELAPESCGQAEAVVLPSCYGLRASVYVDFLLGFLCARTSSADRTFFAAAPPRNILHVLHLLVRRQEPGHGEQT
jgi:hypothetical protein